MDVTQEVFYRYLKNEEEFASEEHEKNWLYYTASNICRSYWRSGWYKHILLSEKTMDDVCEENPLQNCIEKEESRMILEAMFKLPMKYREILHFYYYEDMSIKEISYITGKKESTIQSQLSRGRDKLKVLLKESGYARF